METVHRTELEGAEVCSGRKFQRREAVLAFGGGGYAREDYFSAECRVTGSKRHAIRKAREESVTLG